METGYQPKCIACVDGYRDECHCQKSVYCGMSISAIPWGGLPPASSRNASGGHDKPKKKRRKKYPSMEEFEFGV